MDILIGKIKVSLEKTQNFIEKTKESRFFGRKTNSYSIKNSIFWLKKQIKVEIFGRKKHKKVDNFVEK